MYYYKNTNPKYWLLTGLIMYYYKNTNPKYWLLTGLIMYYYKNTNPKYWLLTGLIMYYYKNCSEPLMIEESSFEQNWVLHQIIVVSQRCGASLSQRADIRGESSPEGSPTNLLQSYRHPSGKSGVRDPCICQIRYGTFLWTVSGSKFDPYSGTLWIWIRTSEDKNSPFRDLTDKKNVLRHFLLIKNFFS